MKTSEVQAILDNIKYLDWKFTVKGRIANPEVPVSMQVSFEAPCTKTGEEQGWKSRKWIISQHMVKSEIVLTAFKAMMTAIEHEARESFFVEGQPIFGPHINVDVLIGLYKQGRKELQDTRPEMVTNDSSASP